MKKPAVSFKVLIWGFVLVLTSVTCQAGNIWENKNAQEQTDADQLVLKDDAEVSPTNFYIPEKLGTIREIWIPEENKEGKQNADNDQNKPVLVVLIQDAHCNVEAQTNISEMLDYMIKTYNLNFIAVEGYEGYYDTSKVHALPDKKLKNEILEYFFDRGRVTGVEYLALIEPPSFDIFGIEHKKAYYSNYKAFLNSIKLRPDAEKFIKTSSDAVWGIIEKTYTDEEKKFIDTISEYSKGQLEISDYVRVLEDLRLKYAITDKFENFDKFLKIMEIEDATDKDLITDQQDAVLNEAQRKLSSFDKEELVKITLQFKTGKASSTKFYYTIKKLCEKVNMDLNDYPDLKNYIEIVALQFTLNLKQLLLETEQLNNRIAEQMFEKAPGKLELFKLVGDLKIMGNLYLLELTREQWYYYTNNKRTIKSLFKDTNKVSVDGKDYPLDFKRLPDTKPAEDFYEAALVRDKILENNAALEARMKKKDFYVVVSGGFHTDGFVEELQAKGTPYAVITPLITQHQAKDYYMEVMTSMKADMEEGWK